MFLVLRAQCALTALRHSSRLSAAHVAVQAGFAAGVSPAPRFCVSGQTKNVAAHHFCRTPFLVLRAQCALTALRHSGCLSAAHVAVQAGFAAGDNPCTPFLSLRPDEKCCFTTFLPGSVPCAPCAMRTHPCAPCAMRTHRTASQQSLVRRTCRRTSGICRRGLPLHPVFLCLRPDEKCCCAPFLPDSVPCAPCAMRTHRTALQKFFCAPSAVLICPADRGGVLL